MCEVNFNLNLFFNPDYCFLTEPGEIERWRKVGVNMAIAVVMKIQTMLEGK